MNNKKEFYFIELKGKNIIQACKQINQTIEYFYKNFTKHIKDSDLIAIIIPTKNSIPKLKSDPQYLKLSKKVKNNIRIKSRIMEIDI